MNPLCMTSQRHKIKVSCAILLCLVICFALSCARTGSGVKMTEFIGQAMTIPYRIVIGSRLTAQQKQDVQKIIETVFQSINQSMNKWNPESELSRFNALPAGVSMKLSDDLYDILMLTDRLVNITKGRFDPTIEPVQELWKASLKNGKKPSDEALAQLKPALGWIHLHFENGSCYKDHSNTMVDLGGVAKGYAIDKILNALAAEGYQSLYVEWGGEIRTKGEHPSKRAWRVYISRFEEAEIDTAVAIVELKDESLATSGDYLQQWNLDGVLYFHILDPFSGEPLTVHPNSIGSASVACEVCAVADALATAAVTFSTEKEAAEWLESLREEIPELRYWLLTRSET